MTASPASSDVVLALNLQGQAAFLKGMSASSDAVTQFADDVVAANDRVQASFDAVLGASTDMAAGLSKNAATTADMVGTANEVMGSSAQRSADELNAAADEMEGAYGRIGTAAKAAAATSEAAAGTAGSAATGAGGNGILGMLTSMKALALGVSVYAGVSSFSKYNSGLTLLTTQAGLAASKLGAVKSAIDAISGATGTSKISLAQAFYNPISEGFSVGQASTIERYAAMLSKIGSGGGANVPLTGNQGTSYAISTMLQTYGLKPTQQNVAQIAGLINGGVGAGDMQLSDLLAASSTGYFNVTQSYGVSKQDAMGLLSFFTSQGVPAQEAATRSRMFLALMASPSQQAVGYLQALGLTQNQVTGTESELAALGLRPSIMASILRGPNGIANAMSMLDKATAGMSATDREALMAKLFGGGRSDATALTIAQHVGLLSQFTRRVGNMGTPGQFNADWAGTEQSFSYQWGQFTSDLSNLAVSLGHDITPAVEGFMHTLEPLLKFLTGNKVATAGLASVLGGMLLLEVANLAKMIGSTLVGSLKGGVAAIRSLLQWMGILGDDAVATAGKEKVLAGAEVTEGSDALIAGRDTGIAATEMEVSGTGLLGKVGLGGALGGASKLLGPAALIGTAAELGSQALGSYASGNPSSWFTRDVLNKISDQSIERDLHNWTGGLLASGGTIGGGFKTNGPRAIVGEGNPAHPEFVIPTDPAYRSRALGLFGQLGAHLMAAGGIVGTPTNGGVLQALAGSGVQGGAAGGLASLLAGTSGLMGGLGGNLSDLQTTVDNALSTLVPPGGFRTLLLSLVGQLFGAAMSQAGRTGGGSSAPTNPSGNVALAKHLATAYGWGTGQEWQALYDIGQKESGWSTTATNPSSGAYGIPQALPGNKMASAGADWQTNPQTQIRWMLSYIKQRYGDPVDAWAHEMQAGWYASGGVLGPKAKDLAMLPMGSYDVGGYLPEGYSLAFNGTGEPEPVGPVAAGAYGPDRPIVVQVNLDGKQIYSAVVNQAQSEMARR